MHNRPGAYPSLLRLAGILLLLIGCTITACGSTQTPTPRPTAHPTSPVQAKECGVVATFGTAEAVPTQDFYLAGQTGKCFWRAVQRCQPAVLIYINHFGETRVFLVEKNAGRCVFSDIVQQNQFQAKKVYMCAQVEAATSGALKFSACGSDGDITVPLPERLFR